MKRMRENLPGLSSSCPGLPGRTGLAVVAAGLLLLAGCSSIPDEANPVEWYKGVAGLFQDDEDQLAKEQAKTSPTAKKPIPGAKEPFPNLSSVPSRPKGVSSSQERQKIAKGLAADRDRAQYSDIAIRRGMEEGAPPPPPSAAPVKAPAAAKAPAATKAPAPIAKAPVAKTPPPPPPLGGTVVSPAPRTAPPAAAPAAAPPRAQTVAEHYLSQLARSAPTVSTAPAGPTSPQQYQARERFSGVAPASAPSVKVPKPPPSKPRPVRAASPSVTVDPGALGGFSRPVSGSFKAASLKFANGSSRLSAKNRRELRKVAKLHRQRGGVIRVVGHASSRTKDMNPLNHQIVNFSISMDRAGAVTRALIKLGVNRDSIVIGAKSDHDPVYYEFMPSGEAGNRRTDVFMEY